MRQPRPKTRVAKANVEMDLMSLCSKEFLEYPIDNKVFKVACLRPETMSESEKEQLMHLLELNMKESYMETPSGWNRQEKESEMFDPAARHLVLLSRDQKIAAFSHFRFDMDYGVDVIYCYEIHIKECFQKKGIGRFLMEVLEHLMFVFGLSKLVLTVFKSNKNAIGFYTKIGFSIDETSPEDTHYLIMSKLNAKKVDKH